MIEAFIITGMVLFAAVTGEVYHKAKENEKTIKAVLNHLDLKVVEEFTTVTSHDFFGETITENKLLKDRRIEPKTDNEKRIEELQKEIETLRELDKELRE